jgi:hypothetical protein
LDCPYAEWDICALDDRDAGLLDLRHSRPLLLVEKFMFPERPVHPPQLDQSGEENQDDATPENLYTSLAHSQYAGKKVIVLTKVISSHSAQVVKKIALPIVKCLFLFTATIKRSEWPAKGEVDLYRALAQEAAGGKRTKKVWYR